MVTSALAITKEHSFLAKVYGWMALALFVTGMVAVLTVSSPTMLQLIFSSRLVFYGLIIGELILVIYLSAAISKMSAQLATVVFMMYAILNGLTFSAIFLVFTSQSIGTTFLITSLTFAGMALYGYTTDRDLTTMGNIAFMGLLGIILSGLVNLILQNNTFDLIISGIGILVFVGLIAYDTQKLKNLDQASLDANMKTKAAVMGALTLYLDFINLFLKILRFTGKRK